MCERFLVLPHFMNTTWNLRRKWKLFSGNMKSLTEENNGSMETIRVIV